MTTIEIVRFCAGECDRQQTGPLAVADMVDAYSTAKAWGPGGLTTRAIERLGVLVDPQENKGGYRQTPVRFADGTVLSGENVRRQMVVLAGAASTLLPAEFYQEFQEIHPFKDGNGRVGAILFNLLSGSILHPRIPPEFNRKGNRDVAES